MKKQHQLGMNPSTASGRLVKDLLFSFVKDTPCFHCGGSLTRETFSIEHKTPWLDSEDPAGLFFDLDNISFSHHACNVSAARRPHKKFFSKEEKNKDMALRQRNLWKSMTKEEQQRKRREKYLRWGK